MINTLQILKVDFLKMSVSSFHLHHFQKYLLIFIEKVVGSVNFASSATSDKYDTIFMNNRFNLCNILNSGFTFITQYISEMLKNYTNYEMKCPLSKGRITITDYPIDDSLVPKVIGGMKFRLHFTLYAKVAGVRKLLEMYDMIIDGELIRG